MKVSKEYINLLPREEKKRRRAVSTGFLLFLVFVLLWLAVLGWQMNAAWKLKKRLASLAANKQALQQEVGALYKELGISTSPGASQDKAALINSFLNERVSWSAVFKQFSIIVPKGLWFDSLEGNASDRAEIRIRGGAFNYLSVAEFMLAMEKSGYFENPQLAYAQKAVVQGQDVIGFEIICGIKRAQGMR
jgi:Tfp pilus assembly protein PilN